MTDSGEHVPRPGGGDVAPAPSPKDLRASAQGWHGLQLAVLGFVGLCGVLREGGPVQAPRGVQIVAAVLALSALAIACCSAFLVGRAAWPLYGPRTGSHPPEPRRASRDLRVGIALTFTAVALLALSTSVSWWPSDEDGGAGAALIRVSTAAGTVCGSLGEGGDGFLTVRVDERVLPVPLSDVVAVRPAASCD
ncbi:hypothetical protein J7E88_32335 [Streptomyces sp. ISL-10]|uniref:hypothetical protein n=1 Tax=Streptomyces sp. ISL-10 TaxID=2819172 RepID=UPI001BE7C983|nr:hypothetical protein [Streptomyces sp. ISL-10]MBT2369836.1 hypothetical protein [Streptomyces sp. ISL-10]